jgi:hypothetical protein
MISVILAAFIATSLYFSLQGVVWGTYAILFVLSLNVIMVVFAMSILTGLQRTYLMEADKRIKELNEADANTNAPAVFLVRLILLACVWHIYTLDYVLFAGISGVTVITTLLSLSFKVFDVKSPGEKP